MLATVLAAAAGFAILPYSAIGILSPLIIEDSGMTRAQLGWLLTVIAFTGAVMAPVLGRAADLVDGRLGIVALFAVGCLSFVALGVAPNYAVLLGACAVAGVAQGAAHPATNKLISDHISPGRRGVITGIKVSGNQFAILIGGVLLPAGALIVGWRATLYGVAGAGCPGHGLFLEGGAEGLGDSSRGPRRCCIWKDAGRCVVAHCFQFHHGHRGKRGDGIFSVVRL